MTWTRIEAAKTLLRLWVRNLQPKRTQTPVRRPQAGFRPYLELLEDRTVPSTITWTGANSAVDNNWSDGLNWQGGVAPGSGDIANFTASGTQSFTANVDKGFTVAGVTIDGTWDGAINVNAALTVTGNLTLASGSFGGPGAVSIAGKASTWTGGTLFPGTGGFTNKGTLTIDTSSGNVGLFTPLSGWLADGNANDSGLDGNTGTLEGGATFASGVTGQAFSFNGSNAYVQAANTQLWGYGSKDFSIDLWVNFTSVPSSTIGDPSDVFIGEDDGSGSQNKWFFALGGGDLNFHINNTSDVKQFIDPVSFTPTLNQWYNLAITRSANVFTIYVNGVALGSQTNSTPIPTGITAPLTIGQAEGIGYVNGLEDDVAVYNRALSGADIQAIMNGQGAGTFTNNGTINLGGSNSLFLGNGAALDNVKGAKFNLTADANLSNFLGSTFTNAGTLTKIKGTGISTIAASTLSNTGTVKVSSGKMDISAPVSQVSGSTLTAGTWSVSSTAKISAALDIASAGNFTILGGAAHVTLSGPDATFSNLNGLNAIDKGGSFSLLGGSSFTTAGALTNNGSVTLSPSSILTVSGSYTQSSTGALAIQLGGTSSAPTFGQLLSTTGSVTLAGKLSVTSTVLPAVGSSFNLLDNEGNAAIGGAFANLAQGSTFTVKKGTTAMTFAISYTGGDDDGSNNVVITRTA